jgi:hypothetical protein
VMEAAASAAAPARIPPHSRLAHGSSGGQGVGSRGWGEDAIEAAALASALAEGALEFERDEHTAGPWKHALQHLCDFSDSGFGPVDWPSGPALVAG